ncbi:F-box only protein 5 [Nasonia vitripennis]|uniref:F-box domain-containing protein n=1 Tax=Nasonia vitripennis TaxID=7425 RepID=A0A7M7QI44_NASVI|nr:F-box only protein 5 [Nasonia vitripennis]
MFHDIYEENIHSRSYDLINKSKKSSMESYDSGYLSITPSNSHGSSYHSNLPLYFTKKSYKTKYDSYKFKHRETFNACDAYLLSSTPKSSTINYSYSQISGYKSPSQCQQNSFKMELRSQKKSRMKPLEFSTCSRESLDNDNVKLLVPQSTPNFFNSPILPSSIYKIAFSPITYKNKPGMNSINSKKFCKLSISESIFTSKKNRPKRLDFSKRAILSSFQKQRVTPDYTGKETVDIFKLLAEKSNHPRIITKILSYLNLQDLCSVTMVSKSWQRICSNDIKAEERRLKYITLKQCSKENIILLSKSKLEDLVQLTPKARYSRKGFLTAVSTNLLQVPKMHFEPDSPPVSPSKVIFNSFIKASRSLPLRDQLVPCPQCKFACRVKHDNNTGLCSRQGCPMLEFCILCSSELHLGKPCKMPLLATPTKRSIKQQPVVGTKQCKKNLRRISRLV